MEKIILIRDAFSEFASSSAFFGTVLTISTYSLGSFLKSKRGLGWLNPMLFSILASIFAVLIFKIDLKKYADGTKIISYFLTPATVCLAIPLYEQFQKLRDNWLAVILGVFSGSLTSVFLVLCGTILFSLSHAEYASLLPKSITTAIGIVLSEQYGGIAGIAVGAICFTGILGNVFCEKILRVFRVNDSVSKGIAIGTSSHALGTSRALEIGEVEGAMSGLSIALAGLLTVILASFFIKLA